MDKPAPAIGLQSRLMAESLINGSWSKSVFEDPAWLAATFIAVWGVFLSLDEFPTANGAAIVAAAVIIVKLGIENRLGYSDRRLPRFFICAAVVCCILISDLRWTSRRKQAVAAEKKESVETEARDAAFQGEMLARIPSIAYEPNPEKRQEKAEALIASIVAKRIVSPSAQKAVSTSGVQPSSLPDGTTTVAPASAPSITTQSSSDLSCPPPHHLEMLWFVQNTGVPKIHIDFVPQVLRSLHPALLAEFQMPDSSGSPLRPDEAKAYEAITADLGKLLPKPQSITLANGDAVPTHFAFENVDRDNREPAIVRYWFRRMLPDGTDLGGTMATAPIANLSENGRQAVRDLDDAANALADATCRQAMSRLVDRH